MYQIPTYKMKREVVKATLSSRGLIYAYLSFWVFSDCTFLDKSITLIEYLCKKVMHHLYVKHKDMEIIQNMFYITPIQHGGGVYDLDNLMIFSPRRHQTILSRSYNFGKG